MGNNLYSNLVNFYNINDENFKEFMAEIYKKMLTTHRDVQYVKEHLTEEIEKKLEIYLVDGKFNINIEEKVNEFLENNQEIKDINTQLTTNINNIKNISSQLNNYTTTTYKRYSQAMFSFSDDDGNTDLLTTIIPLSKELNVPFTIYTWYNSPIFNNYGDMQNMYWNYGWEFGYHTTGKITEQTNEVIHKAIIEFKNNMGKLGFHVDTFAYGYGSFDDRTVEIAKQYFNVALGTVMEDKYYNLGLINNTSDMYRSKRVYISSWTPIEDYKKLVDEALENNYWIVFFQHSRELTEKPFILDKLKQLIQYIQGKGGRIETVSNAFKILN